MLELLYEAYHSEYGIVVETDDVEKLRQKLYQLRKPHKELACLSFATSPMLPKTNLWIVRRPD